jgi:uncharacterized protein
MRKILLVAVLCPLLSMAQIPKKAESFPLSDVRLLDGPFKHAEQLDVKYILEMDVDRLLAPYLREAGLKPKAESYGNWENTGLDGHIGGHYLSALSMMYASTGDQRIKERMEYMISEFKRCQDNTPDGYLGGVPGSTELWKNISQGKINAASFSLNNKWVPLYNIHKIYAGLRDAWLFGESVVAKEMLIKLTDWACKLVENLTDEQIQDMLRSEHGGLNEVFADVAAITGESKYLKLARQFSHQAILNPLLKGEDKLTGMHANTQIPKVIGYKRVADVDGDNAWDAASRFFWETVVDNRSVSIGGNSVREHFHPTNDFSSMISSEEGPETCNTYNMLRLTKMLFETDPKVRYTDYYERALYNHILSTQNPETGGFVYFTPMRSGHYRVYSQPHTSFWCCVGSGLENHAKYGEMIYSHSGNKLFVNLFIASKLNWKSQGIRLKQQTKFPDEEQTSFVIETKKKSDFELNLRCPSWIAEGQLEISINGKKQIYKPNSNGYVAINRTWKNGDRVVVNLPMHTNIEQLPDKSNYYSLLHGPIVLASKTGQEQMDGLFADDSRGGHIAHGPKIPLNEMPILESQPNEIVSKIQPKANQPMAFTLENLHSDKYEKMELMPFYKLHESRYMVYWHNETKEGIEQIKEQLAREEAEKQKLAQATIDMVYPGEQQPESDHFFKSENTQAGEHRGRHWRTATGWFSYELRDKNLQAKTLRIMYFGADRDRQHRITINGKAIAEVVLDGSKGETFFTIDYAIPQELVTASNGVLIIKFEAINNAVTAGIYEVRLLKE